MGRPPPSRPRVAVLGGWVAFYAPPLSKWGEFMAKRPRPPGDRGADPAASSDEQNQEIAVPPCPAGLSAEAEEFWAWSIRELHRLRRYTSTDLPALRRMILAYHFLTEAETDVLKNGRTITITPRTGNPYEQTAPSVAHIKTFGDQVRKWFGEFGFTPSGRGSKFNGTPADSALDQFNRETT